MTYDDFCPFYEKGIARMGGFVGKVLFSISLGAAVLAIHYLGIGKTVFENYGWILSIIVLVASLSLFYATHTFRMLLPKLAGCMHTEQQARLMSLVASYLSDRRFVISGLVFGCLNSLMGLLFGLPDVYDSAWKVASILTGYFIAGFVCGLALCGIVGVAKCISAISNNNESLFDYTSHDKCGGTQFIGWALLVFSVVTLIVGVLITLYISFTQWEYKRSAIVNVFYASWIVLPYVASIFVLVVPAISINKSLARYKIEKDKRFAGSITAIFDELERNDVSPGRKSELYADYEFQTRMRKELHEMRTWPFSIGTNSTYFFTLASSAFATITSVNKWLGKFVSP
ncbi:MAG TPA: hypothetical protein VF268_12045 [Gammaproteobacteria bacterium]